MTYYKHSPKKIMAKVRSSIGKKLDESEEYESEEYVSDDEDDIISYQDVETQTKDLDIEPNYRITIDPEQAAFSCLVEGIGFSQFQRLLLFNNIPPPPRNQFFEAQDRICRELVQYAIKNCEHYLSLIEANEAVAFDGSWSQRRHATHCFGSFWAVNLKKFIDFETMSLIDHPDMIANQMESEILSASRKTQRKQKH